MCLNKISHVMRGHVHEILSNLKISCFYRVEEQPNMWWSMKKMCPVKSF